MNPLYQMYCAAAQPNNPMQRFTLMMQAMQNPAAFVRNQFPDIPESMPNDPVQILAYLQRTRGISNDQIRQLASAYPYKGGGLV